MTEYVRSDLLADADDIARKDLVAAMSRLTATEASWVDTIMKAKALLVVHLYDQHHEASHGWSTGDVCELHVRLTSGDGDAFYAVCGSDERVGRRLSPAEESEEGAGAFEE